MPHLPDLSGRRLDRIIFLVYLIVVPVMVVTVLVIVLIQTTDAKDAAKSTAESAAAVARETCVHVNRRDKVLRSVVDLGVSLVTSLNPDLTADQQKQLQQVERRAKALRPQDCSP